MDRLLSLELPGTLVFDYPTTASLTSHIVSQLAAAVQGDKAAFPAAAVVPMSPATGRGVQDLRHSQGQIVVVDAFSGRFAEPSDGGGRSVDTCRVTPFQRWDVDGTAPHVTQRPGARFGR